MDKKLIEQIVFDFQDEAAKFLNSPIYKIYYDLLHTYSQRDLSSIELTIEDNVIFPRNHSVGGLSLDTEASGMYMPFITFPNRNNKDEIEFSEPVNYFLTYYNTNRKNVEAVLNEMKNYSAADNIEELRKLVIEMLKLIKEKQGQIEESGNTHFYKLINQELENEILSFGGDGNLNAERERIHNVSMTPLLVCRAETSTEAFKIFKLESGTIKATVTKSAIRASNEEEYTAFLNSVS